MNQLPETLETERLIIRVARPGDGLLFHEAVMESLDALTPWLGWVSPDQTVEQAEMNCRKAYGRFLLNEDLMALFFLKADRALVGGSGLHHPDWTLRRFEIGYWGRTRFGRRGLMTEGVRALADYALTTLAANRVFLSTDDRNTASWKLAERAGFQHEGTLRNERFDFQGHLRDTRMYSRVPGR